MQVSKQATVRGCLYSEEDVSGPEGAEADQRCPSSRRTDQWDASFHSTLRLHRLQPLLVAESSRKERGANSLMYHSVRQNITNLLKITLVHS